MPLGNQDDTGWTAIQVSLTMLSQDVESQWAWAKSGPRKLNGIAGNFKAQCAMRTEYDLRYYCDPIVAPFAVLQTAEWGMVISRYLCAASADGESLEYHLLL